MKQICIKREISNDCLTPILVYQALGGIGCCILESAFETGEGKVSYIGLNPLGTFTAVGEHIDVETSESKRSFCGDPYEALKRFSEGHSIFGFIGYNAVRLKEAIPNRHPPSELPDFFFHFYQTVIKFDHEKRTLLCIHEGSEEEVEALFERCFHSVPPHPLKQPISISLDVDVGDQAYGDLVEQAKQYIQAGDIFQVVLSRTFHTSIQSQPFEVYRALRHVSPAPYLFFFEEEAFAIAGASPELLISVQGDAIESVPIAGTSPKTESFDSLLSNPKECAEHVMLVDLARNDVGIVAEAGSVCVTGYKIVKSFSHVNHIVSRVKGRLQGSLHPLDALKASFPAGTVSGAPKVRAMEIIDALESTARGLYAGAIVVLDEHGNLTSALAIRTAVIQNSHAKVRTGAGIVLDSDREKEAQETKHKASSVLAALELAEGSLP